MPSREFPEGGVGRSKAVVSTTAVAGAVLARATAPILPGLMFRPLPGVNSRPLLRRTPRQLMLRGFP